MIHTQNNKLDMQEEKTTAAFIHCQLALQKDLEDALTKIQDYSKYKNVVLDGSGM